MAAAAKAPRPRPDITVVIRDPETGREVPAGEIGEVTVRSPYAMRGYAADPELTDAVLRDGWVHTGDYGSFDAGGYLRLFGRMHDVVKVHDTKVAPTEVEKVLVGHPGSSTRACTATAARTWSRSCTPGWCWPRTARPASRPCGSTWPGT